MWAGDVDHRPASVWRRTPAARGEPCEGACLGPRSPVRPTTSRTPISRHEPTCATPERRRSCSASPRSYWSSSPRWPRPIGATERHLRLVVVANGAVIGVVAAVVGAAVGTLGWMVAAPRMESAVGFRIDPWNMPWWLVGATMVAVTVTSTAAAWWPARALARVPIPRRCRAVRRRSGPLAVRRRWRSASSPSD